LRLLACCAALAACTTDADVGAFNDGGITSGKGAGGGGAEGGGGGSAPIDPLPASEARVAAGGRTTCAIRASGAIECWGDNSLGQLGNNDDFVDGPFIESSDTPVDVYGMDDHVQAVFGGTTAQCALKTDGRVHCWGDSFFGDAGRGWPKHGIATYPLEAPGLSSVVHFAIGLYFHCALNVEGSVKCYGLNGSGQLGNGTLQDGYVPANVLGLDGPALQVAAARSGFSACALMATGAVACWGANNAGQLGTGDLADATSASPVLGLESGARAVSVGAEHACALVEGGARCWGSNVDGQLGDGSQLGTMEPGALLAMPDAVALASGAIHTCALGSDGSVRCWGGSYVPNLPEVIIESGAVEIAAGGWHTCARLDDGRLRCWGLNEHGQLGIFGGEGAPL
jgi:alpha-tubulin suppressor-like RCC1 family protein